MLIYSFILCHLFGHSEAYILSSILSFVHSWIHVLTWIKIRPFYIRLFLFLLIYLFICSSIYCSINHSSVHQICSFIYVYFFAHSFIHSFVRSFIHSFVCSFVRSFVHSFIHSFVHSFVLIPHDLGSWAMLHKYFKFICWIRKWILYYKITSVYTRSKFKLYIFRSWLKPYRLRSNGVRSKRITKNEYTLLVHYFFWTRVKRDRKNVKTTTTKTKTTAAATTTTKTKTLKQINKPQKHI